MTRKGSARPVALLWCAAAMTVCGVLAASANDAGDAASATASPEAITDFLIQNVCLDTSRTVLQGVSPIDADPRCAAQRDLAPGENLPYHKHDHPSPGDRAAVARGYQRRDSFPVETGPFGRVVEHSFDFGAGAGRRFGVFDAGTGDGGDMAGAGFSCSSGRIVRVGSAPPDSPILGSLLCSTPAEPHRCKGKPSPGLPISERTGRTTARRGSTPPSRGGTSGPSSTGQPKARALRSR